MGAKEMRERTRKAIFWSILSYILINLGFAYTAPPVAIAMVIWGLIFTGAIIMSALVIMLYIIFVQGPDT